MFLPGDELLAVAEALDRHGYHGLMVSDHLMYPRQISSRYPYSPHPDGRPIWAPETPWPEPWVLIGAMAARTTQLHLSTNVYIAPLRPLLTVAKEVATASVISAGRVALGAGAGWMREEFEIQGQSFDDRGRRFAEMVRALRAVWEPGWVEFHGEFYDVPPMMAGPTPPSRIPIWIGGHSDAALRRAATVGDGWIGTQYSYDEASRLVGRLRGMLADAGRQHEPFEIILAINAMPDVDLYRRAEDELGVTGLMCMPWALRHYSGQPLTHQGLADDIARFADQFVGPMS